jgi:hypothetical protein
VNGVRGRRTSSAREEHVVTIHLASPVDTRHLRRVRGV